MFMQDVLREIDGQRLTQGSVLRCWFPYYGETPDQARAAREDGLRNNRSGRREGLPVGLARKPPLKFRPCIVMGLDLQKRTIRLVAATTNTTRVEKGDLLIEKDYDLERGGFDPRDGQVLFKTNPSSYRDVLLHPDYFRHPNPKNEAALTITGSLTKTRLADLKKAIEEGEAARKREADRAGPVRHASSVVRSRFAAR